MQVGHRCVTPDVAHLTFAQLHRRANSLQQNPARDTHSHSAHLQTTITFKRIVTLVRLGDDCEDMELTQTVLSLKPNEEFQYTMEYDWADTDYLFLVEARNPNACTIRCELTVFPKDWHEIWMNMARRSMKDRFDSHLAKLKALVEAEPTATI